MTTEISVMYGSEKVKDTPRTEIIQSFTMVADLLHMYSKWNKSERTN